MNMNLKNPVFHFLTLSIIAITACNEDTEAFKPSPIISEIEIGSSNNETGVIGRDLHFNAEVLAGEKIDSAVVRIEQRKGESYEGDWSFAVSWDQYRGAKNATIHKHFDIPEDAIEGLYDFHIIVIDLNGTSTKETREIQIVDPANLAVDPGLHAFAVEKIHLDGSTGFANFYSNGEFRNADENFLRKGESILSWTQISNVKDDGILYSLLIKKSMNHKPETIDAIEFDKVIVTEKLEHSGMVEVDIFSNYFFPDNTLRERPTLKIGAAEDNQSPEPNPISGDKAWENGTYYYGFVYTNTTHDLSTFHYIEFDIILE